MPRNFGLAYPKPGTEPRFRRGARVGVPVALVAWALAIAAAIGLYHLGAML